MTLHAVHALGPRQGKTLPLGTDTVRVMYSGETSPYSLVEWIAAPGVPGPPLHIHRETDEAFYVVDGTFGFQTGGETVNGLPGSFIHVPKGLAHTYWNDGSTTGKLLIVISPPGFEAYFEKLSEGLANAGDSQEAALQVRKDLSARYDIEVVGPSRRAQGQP